MKISQIATVQLGYSFRSRLEPSAGGNVAVIQMKDLLGDAVSCDQLVRIDMKAIKRLHLVQKGDLVFRSRGHLATSAVLLDHPGKAIVAAPLIRIRITKPDRILPEYLNWYLCQRDAQIFLTSRAKSTIQKMITKRTLEDLEVAIPSLVEQKDIVELASLMAKEQSLLHSLAVKREQHLSTILLQFAVGAKNGY